MPAVTGRTRRGFAPTLGGGKGVVCARAAYSTRGAPAAAFSFDAVPHPVCPPQSFQQDEVILFIAQPGGEVKQKKFPAVLHKKRTPPHGLARKTPKFVFIH